MERSTNLATISGNLRAQILNTTISVWRPSLCDSHLRITSSPYLTINDQEPGQKTISRRPAAGSSACGGRVGNRVEQLTVSGGRRSVAGNVVRGIVVYVEYCGILRNIVRFAHLPHSLYPMYPMYPMYIHVSQISHVSHVSRECAFLDFKLEVEKLGKFASSR